MDKLGCFLMVICELIGVFVGMVFWNVLVILGVCCFVMVIVCGNIVVMKVFEKCLGLYCLIGDVMVEGGLLKGVFNIIFYVVEDGLEVVNVLIDYLLICCINFIGLICVG